jgi:hypothetical protein
MPGVARDDEVAEMFRREDTEALVALARVRPGAIVRFLNGQLYAADQEEKWRAVRAFGALAGEPGVLTEARLQDLLRRFLWALNDESGAAPFGVPEAIGEILSVRPGHRASLLPILCSMLTDDETFQTGPVERGIYWALGRIGPSVVAHCPEVLAVVVAAAAVHPDAETRAAAASALERLGPTAADPAAPSCSPSAGAALTARTAG